MTVKEEIIEALTILGGEGTLKEIYDTVRSITERKIPRSFEAGIRKVIEENSSDSANFKGKEDLFYVVNSLHGGVWGLLGFYDGNATR